MSNDPYGLFYISVSWLNSSILRFKEQRRQNSHRKLWFMVLLIFLSNFLSLIISIFQFKYFSLSGHWHFHSSSFAHWMWLAECFENNYFIWIYSICTTIKLSSTLVNASVKHFYHFMWILHVPFRACFNVLLRIHMMDNITEIHWRERLFILWNPNKSSRKACRVGLMPCFWWGVFLKDAITRARAFTSSLRVRGSGK